MTCHSEVRTMSPERPILYSAPMVLALLAGRKTQTRRVVAKPWKIEPEKGACFGYRVHRLACEVSRCEFRHSEEPKDENVLACGGHELRFDGVAARSPYGQPGDRLWGREGVRRVTLEDKMAEAVEDDTGRLFPRGRVAEYIADGAEAPCDFWDWKNKALPAIHMPRGMCRLLHELVSVRVERLGEISEADAIAEGVTVAVGRDRPAELGPGHLYLWPGSEKLYVSARAAYFAGWDSINGKGAAAKNPWVWVVTFKPVSALEENNG